MSQNLSSAAVVIGALRVKKEAAQRRLCLHLSECHIVCNHMSRLKSISAGARDCHVIGALSLHAGKYIA